MALDPISAIAAGIGGIFQGGGAAIAATQEANTDDICGKKPGFFAKKDKKEAYDECMKKASEARINALNAQAANQPSLRASTDEATKNKWVIPVVIAVVVIAIITTVIIIRRNRKK
jgi:hypothetical protein